MDYFSKFKKRIAPPKAQPTSAMQLAKFHKYWEYVHNIFVLDDRKANMHVQQTEIPSKLRQMVDLLVDEEARQEDNTTGLCMEYFLKNGVLQYLVTISEKEDYPVGIRGEAIRTIASMIDLLDDRFLVHNAVHKPTIKLLRFCVLDDRQSELYSDDLVDLMYIICSKIHGFPALLNIFFHDTHWLTTPQKSNAVAIKMNEEQQHQQQDAHEYEFLLFTYLLRFVHREGRSGDFARTGLLFLVEMATDQLGDFILGSDFATILSAGLGALYSQLPRKLIVKDEAEQIYATTTSYLLGQDGLEEETNTNRFPSSLGAEYSNSPEFRYQLDSFLKLLEFCQDVLMRCPNQAILASLLTNIRANFLENILYPSILECNDLDGSSVAVISYIDLILQTIQQDDLAKVVVGFLMNEDDEEDINVTTEMVSETDHIQIERRPSTSAHITLKDLIFGRLECNSQSTVIATLKLLKTLVTKHCQYSLSLLSIYPDTNKSSMIISHHLREVELYFSLIIAIDAQHAQEVLNCGYEEYLRDVELSMDLDGCYQNMRSDYDQTTRQFDLKETSKAKKRRSFKYGQRHHEEQLEEEQMKKQHRKQMARHCVRSTDRLLQILLNLLSHFFTQSSELNLALTGVIAALAMCPYRSLEGWISFSEQDRTHRDDILVLNPSDTTYQQQGQDNPKTKSTTQEAEDEDDDRSVDFGVERESSQKTMPTFFKSYPPFFTLLRTLTQQVDYYRSEIQAFDQLLEERRNALISGEVQEGTKRMATLTISSPPPPAPLASGRRPSVLRPLLDTPALTPSVSTSTTTTRLNTNMSTILNNPMSPLTVHIKKTNTRIQPLFPSNFINEREEPILDLDDEDEHTFAPKVTDPSRQKRLDKSTEITLSTLLNNVVILEESIKELVALMQVRRSLGIDEIAYV
ncbi:hypothetical protein A0J61_07909 [Choanephora cucurbitarum]|uniref:FHF complex subunit HOOK-interacting protein C-terminal domain-containing protein n=1 Tax=Choanephora cucurbitarum TaxID=101091 RepID=A0A1C7N4J9_9FUNG|nr:hypothetical protein A0J61_07909 [Choanephora cucurbitarum]